MLGPAIRFIAPAQTSCNYLTLAFENFASVGSEGNESGNWLNVIGFEAPDGPNAESRPSSAPANGPEANNHLHFNPYPRTAAPGQGGVCEAGNERYAAGQTVIGRSPQLWGTTTVNEEMMGRLPERDTRQGAKHSRFGWRPSNAMIALIFILIFTLGPYLAFTKHIPFTGYGYQLKATFANAANISVNSPVRIAGVDVGKVIESNNDGSTSTVTFTVEDKGRPIHTDAFAQIRPRIFLEGNFFIDLDPGSPSAPEMDSGATIPVSRTSISVQLDEVLTALQAPVRGRPQPPARKLRRSADPRADRGRRRDPAARGEGKDRRRGPQRRLPLRRAGRPLQRPGHQRLPRHRSPAISPASSPAPAAPSAPSPAARRICRA